MDFKTPLAKVKGLGSAQAGTFHWWMQRVTSVALFPLTMIFIQLLNVIMHASYQEMVLWLSTPFNTVSMVAWIMIVFYHAALGLQVVIEDYVSNESIRIIAIWMIKLSFSFLSLIALFALLRTILVVL